MEETAREVHVGRPHDGEASAIIEEPSLNRVDGLCLECHQRVGAMLGLLEERELVIGEAGLAHELFERYRGPVAPRRLAPGHHEVPVDVAVVEGTRCLAVPNGENPIKVDLVARLTRDRVEPRHAG